MPANYFLKIESPDVQGESLQEEHSDEIEILSFSWGVSQAGGFSYSGGGGGVAKANIQDLSVSFRQCAASPKLMMHCAGGQHFEKATLTCLKAAGTKQEKYLEIRMEDVLISSYQTGGSGDDMPIESMSLNFAKVEEEFFGQKDDGTPESKGVGSYDQRVAVASG